MPGPRAGGITTGSRERRPTGRQGRAYWRRHASRRSSSTRTRPRAASRCSSPRARYRALHQRRRRGRRAHDPGRFGRHDPRLRHEPAVRRRVRRGQLKAITLWGAASAGGGALGPLLGGVLVDTTGWQGLFWIDAAIAAACVPLTLRTVQESSDPSKPRSIDWAGTVLVALALGSVILALSEGNDWGWASAATLGCLAVAIVSGFVLVKVEQRAAAPLVDLKILRNRVLVGATLAILIVAGTINGLMYVLSLHFQNPSALGLSAFEAGLATLPAAAAMIAVTPAIAPLAAKIGGARAIALGFTLATVGFGALVFVKASW